MSKLGYLIRTKRLNHSVMHPNGEDRMTNSVDPDQTALLGAVWSGSALFAQTCPSENLWSLQYFKSFLEIPAFLWQMLSTQKGNTAWFLEP